MKSTVRNLRRAAPVVDHSGDRHLDYGGAADPCEMDRRRAPKLDLRVRRLERETVISPARRCVRTYQGLVQLNQG